MRSSNKRSSNQQRAARPVAQPGTTVFIDTTISDAEASDEYITLARVVKTQGRRGEVAAAVHTDVPGRFVQGMRLFALLEDSDRAPSSASQKPSERDSKAVRRELEVEALWPHKELLVLKVAGVDSISEAEVLVGSELQVPRGERAHLEPGWNYVSDLVGCAVFDQGVEIGRIEDVQFGAGEAPLLIVANGAGKKFDVPFAGAYLVQIDVVGRQLRMNLPQGLLEVNSPVSAEEKLEQLRLPRQSDTNAGGAKGPSTAGSSRRTRRARR